VRYQGFATCAAWHERLRELSDAACLTVQGVGGMSATEIGLANDALELLCRMGVPGYDPWADSDGFEFDHTAARNACRYFPARLRHVKGKEAGKPFVLEPWQHAVEANTFGWKDAEGLRRYRYVFLYVAKKNGKTAWNAGNVLMVLKEDGEQGAELYSAAASKDQAALLFQHAAGMVQQSPAVKEGTRTYGANGGSQQKAITYVDPATEIMSSYRCLAADADTVDGVSPHLIAADELHRHKSPELLSVLRKSMAARAQPLCFMFTTADYHRESVCNTEHEYAGKVRDGTIIAPRYLPVIYEASAEDDHNDPETWHRANPNMGVTVTEETLAEYCQEANEKPSELNDFLRLHLNVKTNALSSWVAAEAWDACTGAVTWDALPETLVGSPCTGGLDLSSRLDLSSFQLWFPESHTSLSWCWMPRENAVQAEKRDRVPYLAWERAGALTLTPGNSIDQSFIAEQIKAICTRFSPGIVGYDSWNADWMRLELEGAGVEMVMVIQGHKTLTEPTKDLQAWVVSGEYVHGGHPVQGWCSSNVMLRLDANANPIPDKKNSTGRIDGIAALLNAVAVANDAEPTESVYEGRGVITL